VEERRNKMAIYDGNKFAQEHLLDVAWRVVGAALKAPQITGRLELKTEILTGEDILPIVELFESTSDLMKLHKVTGLQYRRLIENGQSPVFLNLGADVTISKTGWNCGACGFATCKEFNKFSRESQPAQSPVGGPSCNWLVLDYGIATDHACAEAARCNVSNRICMFEGIASRMLGYSEGCSVVLTLPLGPFKDMYYYSRSSMSEVFNYEDYKEHMFRTVPILFEPFITPMTTPRIKTTNKWWEEPPRYVIPKPDPEQDKIWAEVMKRWGEIIGKKRGEITAKRQSMLGKV
jgi:uncharacterized ferredoxin-like protein